MAITALHIEGFGHYQSFGIDGLGSGLTVLHGPNEAGKSTLTAFVQYILFGPVRGQAPEALAGGRLGGRVWLEGPDGPIHIERLHGAPPSVQVGNRPMQTGEDALRLALGGIDRGLYRAIHAFSAADLSGFDRLGEPELRDRLFTGALAGAGRSVSAAVSQLERRQTALWRPRAGSVIGDLQGRQAELRTRAEAARHQASHLRNTLAEREAAAATHREAHREATVALRSAQRYGALQGALPHHRAHMRLAAELRSLPSGLPVDPQHLEAAARLELEYDRAAVAQAAAERQVSARAQELRALPPVSALYSARAQVDQLASGAAQTLPSLVAARATRLADALRRAEQAQHHAGLSDATALRAIDLSTPTVAALRGLAESLAQHSAALRAHALAASEAQREAPALLAAEHDLAATPLDEPALRNAATVESLQREAPARARADAQRAALATRIEVATAQQSHRAPTLSRLRSARDTAATEAAQTAQIVAQTTPKTIGDAEPALANLDSAIATQADRVDELEAALRTFEDLASRHTQAEAAAQSARLTAEQAARRTAPPAFDPRRRTLGLAAGIALVLVALVAVGLQAPMGVALVVLALGLAVVAGSWLWLGPPPAEANAPSGPVPDPTELAALVATAKETAGQAQAAATIAQTLRAGLSLPADAGTADLVRRRAELRRARETAERWSHAALAVTAHLSADASLAGELATLHRSHAEQDEQVCAWDARLEDALKSLGRRPRPSQDSPVVSDTYVSYTAPEPPAEGETAPTPTGESLLAEASARCQVAARVAEARQALVARHRVLADQQAQRLRQVEAAAQVVAAGAGLAEKWKDRCAEARVPTQVQAPDLGPFLEAAAAARQTLTEVDALRAEDHNAGLQETAWLAAVCDCARETGHAAPAGLAAAHTWIQQASRTLAEDDGRHAALTRALGHLKDATDALAAATEARAALADRRAALLERYGVESTEALQMQAADHLTNQRAQAAVLAAATARDAALGPWAGEPEALAALDAHDEASWGVHEAEALAAAAAHRERAEVAVALGANLETRATEAQRSDAVARAATELGAIEADLDTARRALAVAVLAQALLERTLKRYREAHQPSILRVASQWFATATAGAYTAVDADLEGKGLWVVDASGGRRRAESLSTGATELLYLVLRLGLAADVSRAGPPLPLLLDDVLVNLDPQRAAPVADLLAEVARNTQILLLTCRPETLALITRRVPAAHAIELARFAGRANPVASAATAGQRGQHNLADQQIIDALQQAAGALSKTEIIAQSGLETQHWSPAIKRLKESGLVAQIGDKRGAKYQLSA